MDKNWREQQPTQRIPQPKEPPEKKQGGCAGALLYLMIIVGISAVLSIILLFSANDVFAFVKDDTPMTFTVTRDTSVSEIGKQLDKEGIVNYGFLFNLFVKISGKDGTVSAGDYDLNPSMDYGAIVRSLKSTKDANTVTVTIPEGYTVAQIRQALLDKKVCDRAALDEALTNYPFKHSFLQDLTPGAANWLEGYLFPDTYQFYQGDDAVQVINKMLNNYESKYDEKIVDGAKSMSRSMHEVTIIASMVEREAQKEDEFAKIAGVIYNRLNNSSKFPYLQIDATIQYICGHSGELTAADLQIDSPYNTRMYKGLPPGPIANPGYTALYAATHPESHGYYYYVAMPDGSHLFAKTLSEHNKNIETAKKAFGN